MPGRDIADHKRVSVGQHGDIRVGAASRQRGSSQSLLGEDAAAQKAHFIVAVLCESQNIFRLHRNHFVVVQLIGDDMLSEIRVIGGGISAHDHFHERKIFPRHPPDQGAERGLGKRVLRAEQDLFKAVILPAGAVPGDKRPGFCVQNIASRTRHLKRQFVDGFERKHSQFPPVTACERRRARTAPQGLYERRCQPD